MLDTLFTPAGPRTEAAVPLNPPDIVPVLNADPELGERLPAEEFDAARRALLVRVIELPAGPWAADTAPRADQPAYGLLVLDGALIRQITVAGRPSSELLGAGDLLRPWDEDPDAGVPAEVTWHAVQPTRLAVLDARFLASAVRWPALLDALASRALRRARWLGFLGATKQITRVEGRLLILLWALSERWGVVTPRGVHVRLRLTHEALGRLVGARRPSVTTALGVLAAEGRLERVEDGYRLFGDVDAALRRVEGAAAADQAAAA